MSDFTREMADKIESGTTDKDDANEYCSQIEMFVSMVNDLLEYVGDDKVKRDVQEVLDEIG